MDACEVGPCAVITEEGPFGHADTPCGEHDGYVREEGTIREGWQ